MKNIKFNLVAISVLISSLLFTSCKEEDSITEDQKKEVSIELVNLLKDKGFTFEGNTLVLNEKALNTKTIDLSKSNLTSIPKGLEVFPKLTTINLSGNKFKGSFDFANIPNQVKNIDLSNNELYDFNGLAEVTDTGYKQLKQLDKLILPATARYNMDVIPYFYKENEGKVVIKIENTTTKKLEDYNTLRNIPGVEMKKYLEEKFSSLMKNGKLDILATMEQSETGTNLYLRESPIKNTEGVQYIINNKQWLGVGISLELQDNSVSVSTPYIKIPKQVWIFLAHNVDTPYLDTSNAKSLNYVNIYNNKSLEILDLSHSAFLIDKDIDKSFDAEVSSELKLYKCPNLEVVKFSDNIVKPNKLKYLLLADLPKLKEFDLSYFLDFGQLALAKLPNAKLKMPTSIPRIDNAKGEDKEWESLYFSVSKDMWDRPEIKGFIQPYLDKENQIFQVDWDTELFEDLDDIEEYEYFVWE